MPGNLFLHAFHVFFLKDPDTTEHDGSEKCLLIFKIQVEGSLVQFDLPGDIIHGNVFVPPGKKETLGRIDDLCLPLFLFPLSSVRDSHSSTPL